MRRPDGKEPESADEQEGAADDAFDAEAEKQEYDARGDGREARNDEVVQIAVHGLNVSIGRASGARQPNWTERFVKAPSHVPVMGKVTGSSRPSDAPSATSTGAKCSCVGRAIATPGASSR